MKMLMAGALALAAAAAGAAPVEISWSVMHPTAIDVAYMRRVVEKAKEYGTVDSFEVCGDCHSAYGGINGLSMLDPYPKAHALVEPARVEKARAELGAICDLAHSIGKPLYYWHREIFIPKGLLEDLPQLKDEDGEFDLLGQAYQDYLRFKLDETFKYVPGLDGVVLTLTEADFSVIHNSNPKRYPPQLVVERLVRLFAEEHAKRGKRFILRSFGSNTQDYVDIIGGATRAAKAYGFEIETKVTEADFVPWLPKNPFLKKNPPLTLGAECDALGEYLGAGYLPAAQVARIREYVESGRAEGVDRYAIRIDRVGNSIFDSAHEVNLYAYMRFIRDPSATVDDVIGEYARARFGAAAAQMVPLVKGELEMVRNIHYIASNLTFHSFPIGPNFKTVKAGGIFSLYREGRSLESTKDIWSILSWMKTPPHAQILAEKRRGRELAEAGLKAVEGLKGLLPDEEYVRQRRAFANAVKAAKALEAYTACVVAYFDDMAARLDEPVGLLAASDAAVKTIESMMKDVNAVFVRRGHFTVVGENLDLVYFVGLRFFCRELVREYRIERAMRARLEARAEVCDFVVPGGIYDDNRTIRTMHGAYSQTKADRVVRYAGNPVFPNGTITVRFAEVPGATVEVALDPDGAQTYALAERVERGERVVTIGKKGAAYPGVLSVALVRPSRRGVLCLTFDDRGYDGWTNAIPLFAKYGAHATFFPCGRLGANELAALKALHAAGHAVGMHSEGHRDAAPFFTNCCAATYFREQVVPQLKAYATVGLRPRFFAYPNNRRSDETDAYLSGWFSRFRAGAAVGRTSPANYYSPSNRTHLADLDAAFFPVRDLPRHRVLGGVGVGEYYHTEIEDVCRGIRRAAERDEVLTIFSHAIYPNAKGVAMKTEWLERILATGQACGIAMKSFAELGPVEPERPAAPLELVLSFDDGVRDHYRVAADALEARGWRGVFCIVTDWIGKGEKKLTWDEVRELVRRGHVIATHTKTHVGLGGLCRRGQQPRVRSEIRESCDIIERETGVRPKLLCLPGTDCHPDVIKIAREEGVVTMTVPRIVFGEQGCRSRETIRELRRRGVRRADFLVHGIRPEGGGWKPFPSLETFVAFLDGVKAAEAAGDVRVGMAGYPR